MQYHGTGFKTIIRETCFPGNVWGWGWGWGGGDTSVGYKGLNVLGKWQICNINTLL